jgi:hypothetical protein
MHRMAAFHRRADSARGRAALIRRSSDTSKPRLVRCRPGVSSFTEVPPGRQTSLSGCGAGQGASRDREDGANVAVTFGVLRRRRTPQSTVRRAPFFMSMVAARMQAGRGDGTAAIEEATASSLAVTRRERRPQRRGSEAATLMPGAHSDREEVPGRRFQRLRRLSKDCRGPVRAYYRAPERHEHSLTERCGLTVSQRSRDPELARTVG